MHVIKIRNKAFSNLGFIKRSCIDFHNPNALKTLYFSFIRSILEYGSLIWTSASTNHLQSLDRVQNNFLRFISFQCKINRIPHSNYEGLLQYLNIKSLNTRRITCNLIFLFKLINNFIDCPELLELINFKYPSRLTRTKQLFYIDNYKSRYLFFSPHALLMINGNMLNFEIDIFNCNLNTFKKSIHNNIL